MKFYFVIARYVNKDGTLSNRFKECVYTNKKDAEICLKNHKAGDVDTLPYQLIECDIKAKKEFVWNQRKAPKRVKDIYNQVAGLD